MIGLDTTFKSPVKLVLDNQGAGCQFSEFPKTLDLNEALSQQLVPEDSGGYLVAMHLFRRLLIDGPSKYGNVTYLGTEPHPYTKKMYDVLTATRDAIDLKFYVDLESGLPTFVELTSELDSDPCEIQFQKFDRFGGSLLPKEVRVMWNDEVFSEFRVDSYKFSEPSKVKK